MAQTVALLQSRRWRIAAAAMLLQLCLGTVYAWSHFSKPLQTAYGWSASQVQLTFSVAICCLGLSAAWGGVNLGRWGPRRLAVAGGMMFGLGHLLAGAALAWRSVHLLWAGYGVVGGVGLGLGYVTPVATTAKWFPDRKGLATGMVVMGFGLGALMMSLALLPAMKGLTGGSYPSIFLALGGLFLIVATWAGSRMRNPPAVPDVAGASNEVPLSVRLGGDAADPPDPAPPETSAGLRHLPAGRFAMMWLVFFCNIVAGISLISYQSPMIQDLWSRAHPRAAGGQLEAVGAAMIAVSALFNGLGRLFWGGLSDRIGRLPAFRAMLTSQLAAFGLLIWTDSPWVFAALVCYVLLCYGGGFGTMPSFVLDTFGARRMPAIYGAMLTAWSAAGVVGPMIVARLEDLSRRGAWPLAASTGSFLVGAGLLAVGLAISFCLRPRPAARA
jgi:OFA family oxalate/formate antiporter-like MFS transporter